MRTTPHHEQSDPGRNIHWERIGGAGVVAEEAQNAPVTENFPSFLSLERTVIQ